MEVRGLELEEAREDDCTRLTVRGELDISNANLLRQRPEQLKDEESNVRLDLSGLEFIDSSGAHVLIDAINDARADHWQIMLDPDLSPQVRRFIALIKASGFDFDF